MGEQGNYVSERNGARGKRADDTATRRRMVSKAGYQGKHDLTYIQATGFPTKLNYLEDKRLKEGA